MIDIKLDNIFDEDNLKKIYNESVKYKSRAGLDRVDRKTFEKNIGDYVSLIRTNVLRGTYKFTTYRKSFICKGEKKNPRVINVPTIKDKLTLHAINDYLNEIYNYKNCTALPYNVIDEIIRNYETNQYNYFLKYDIKEFYSSINHRFLINTLRKTIKNEMFIKIIRRAVKNPAIEYPVKSKNSKRIQRKQGVPEGLNISNSLANIFMIDLDDKMKLYNNIIYLRYVDDVIILCNETDKDDINNLFINEIEKLKLRVNKKKINYGLLSESSFEYLGYSFNPGGFITVRDSSILNFENNLEKMFSNYKYSENKNINSFEWKLNLKISGCILNNKKYGWISYFSQINDISLLYRLDCLINKLLNRYNISLKPKRFVRTYFETKKDYKKSNYILNYDKFNIEDMRYFFLKMNINCENKNDFELQELFYNIIYKEVNSLEKDVKNLS